MAGPSLADLEALAGEPVCVVVPKPREDQRLVGVVSVTDGTVELRLDGDAAGTARFRTVELRERARDGVVQAYHSDGSLVGRVADVSRVEP